MAARRASRQNPQTAPPFCEGLHHLPQLDLRWKGDNGWLKKGQALIGRGPNARDAIIFIHGWRGSAGGTWEMFHQAIGTAPETAQHDVFFLEYESLRQQVSFCADCLREFLVDLLLNPVEQVVNPTIGNPAYRRKEERKYNRIIIVAHSMGAVISRRAIIDLHQDFNLNDDDLGKFRLLYFAPAHLGSHLPLLIANGGWFGRFPCSKLIGFLMTRYYQSLTDLEVGSVSLQSLFSDTKNLIDRRKQANASIRHLTAAVLHAEHDNVVIKEKFGEDFPTIPVMRQTHSSICKPKKDYGKPVEALYAYLKAFN